MSDRDVSLLLGDLDLNYGPYEAQVGTSFGGWQAVTSQTSSLFLDGSYVFGEQSGNREIHLLVQVESADRYGLIEACEALLVEANKQANTLTWVDPEGPTVVYEVFRVHSPQRTDDESEARNKRTYELVFPALPFTRSATRESTGALSPTITIDGFESAFTGALLTQVPDGFTSGPEYMSIPVGVSNATPLVNVSRANMSGTFTAASNCTVTFAADHAEIAAIADGDMEVSSASSWAVSGNFITVGLAMNYWDSISNIPQVRFMAGIEWFDSGGISIRVDWGTPTYSSGRAYDNEDSRSVWATAPVPATAAWFKIRARVMGAKAGAVPFGVAQIFAVSSSTGTVTPVAGGAHDGNTGIDATLIKIRQDQYGSFDGSGSPAYLYRTLAAALDLSGKAEVQAWVKDVTSDPTPSAACAYGVRLWDANGHWSRYELTAKTRLESNTWTSVTAELASPDLSSAAGPVDLTAVTAYDVDVRQNGSGTVTPLFIFDSLAAGDMPTATTSPRGTVYELDQILGSARSPSQVEVSAGLALTDWLVAAVPSDNGFPLLSVSSNVAKATAPAKYDGTYSILGCVSPATALTSPTCTVTQTINGTQVASVTLTGTQRSGNRYVDFGSIALPLVAVPDENQQVAITFTLAPSSTSWTEVLVIDTDASLAWVDNLATAMAYGWVDEPDPTAGLGRVWIGTASDRSDARALINPPTLSRPLLVQAPSTRLLVYSTTTAPDITLSYYPRWLIEPPS